MSGCDSKQQHQHSVQNHAGGDNLFIGERIGGEVPRKCSFLKSRLVCFGSHSGELRVQRMKTTLVSCTNERQGIASEVYSLSVFKI